VRINQYKTFEGRSAYVTTLNLTEDVLRMIAVEISSNEQRVRVRLESGKSIYGKHFQYAPIKEGVEE
jgi:hypothetical protein